MTASYWMRPFDINTIIKSLTMTVDNSVILDLIFVETRKGFIHNEGIRSSTITYNKAGITYKKLITKLTKLSFPGLNFTGQILFLQKYIIHLDLFLVLANQIYNIKPLLHEQIKLWIVPVLWLFYRSAFFCYKHLG